MGTKRLLVVASLLSILTACTTNSRPDADNSPMPRAVSPAPAEESSESTSKPDEQATEVSEPAPADEIAAPAAQPAKPAPVESPAPAPVAKPPQAAVAAKPVQAPKVVKPVKPVQAKPLVSKPRPEPKPAPVVAPSPPPVAEVIEEAPVADAGASRIQGKLDLIAGSGQSLSANDMSQAVVYFVPDSPTAKAKPGHFRIYTHDKEFEPASMVIPLGSTISFPNQDEILHNVFSVSPKSSFDLGIYGEGKSADYTFKRTGLVLINCNVHQSMQANVLVVDTPYIVSPDNQGRFTLANLPAGSGKLSVWHPRANVQEQVATLPLKSTVSVRLVLTKPRITEHLNKENKAYR